MAPTGIAPPDLERLLQRFGDRSVIRSLPGEGAAAGRSGERALVHRGSLAAP